MEEKRKTNWRNTIIIIVVAVAVAILFGLVGLAVLIIILLIYYWRRGRLRRARAGSPSYSGHLISSDCRTPPFPCRGVGALLVTL